MKNNNFMRTSLAILGISLSQIFNAQITVDNNASAPVTQNDLQTAIDNAAEGSTIYIQPSSNSYGNININKKINLVGKSSSDPAFKSTIQSINLLSGSSDSTFKGLNIEGDISTNSLSNSEMVENVLIRDSKMYSLVIGNPYNNGSAQPKSKGFTIEGCYLENLYSYFGAMNLVFKNNIVRYITVLDASSIFFSQNIMLPNVNIQAYSSDILNISNSIFITNSDAFGLGTHLNINGKVNFQNCLTYDYGSAHNYIINDNTYDNYVSQFSGMLYNTDPLFVSVNSNIQTSDADTSIANNYNLNPLNDDIHLQANSPAKGAGQYGEDLGVFHNYNFRNFGYPHAIPFMKITNAPSTVPTGGTMQVTITAKAQ